MTGTKKRAGPAGLQLRASHKDGPQVIETCGKRWSDAAQARFLDALAATCNVRHAAREAGFSAEAVYRRRRRDPGFARDWAVALEHGYDRLETALVRAAADTMEGFEPDPDAPFPDITVREALDVLRHHRAEVRGEAWRAGGAVTPPKTLEDLRESILIKFEAIEAMRVRG